MVGGEQFVHCMEVVHSSECMTNDRKMNIWAQSVSCD